MAAPPHQDNQLRLIEDMLHEIGAATPANLPNAASQQQSNSKIAASTRASVMAQQSKDCLAVESRAQFATPKFQKRAQSETPSLIRGAPMGGKDNTRKRFFGKGFQPPPAESPGPIYEPVGFVDERTTGKSFSRAEKLRDSVSRASSAQGYNPQMHSMPPSVGRQAESRMGNAPTAVFTKSERFNPKQMISRAHSKGAASTDAPAPTEYHKDILRMTDPGKGVSFSGSRAVPTSKIFISRAHVVDCIGAASPGPQYNPYGAIEEMPTRSATASTASAPAPNPGDGKQKRGKFQSQRGKTFAVISSQHKNGPSFTFGVSDRPSDRQLDTEDPTVFSSDAQCIVDTSGPKPKRRCMNQITKSGTTVRHTPMQKFISHEHSKLQCTTETPGPAYYSVNAEPTKKQVQGVSFPQEPKNNTSRFYSKELSLSKGKDSPGMRYAPKFDIVTRATPGAIIGGTSDHNTEAPDRFTDKVFLGKGMGEKYGGASPGPAYSQDYDKKKGPSFTIVHKEKHFDHVNPAPSRPRWVSGESAKENRGAFSPGPKYNTATKNFGAAGPSYTFGITDREFGPQFSEEQKAKFGSAEKPYTSPGEARFISHAHSKTAAPGMSSPGPQQNVTPKYDVVQKKAPSAKIIADTSKPRIPRSEREGQGPSSHLEVRREITEVDSRAHAFPKAERMPSTKVSAGPEGGPTSYKPKFNLLEKRVPGTSFGGLS